MTMAMTATRGVWRQDRHTGKMLKQPPNTVAQLRMSTDAKKDGRVQVKRGLAEGGYGGLTEYTEGKAWHRPNFRVEGKVYPRGSIVHDVITTGMYIEKDSLPWVGHVGQTVRTGNTMSGNKAEPSLFFKHRQTKAWGAVFEAAKCYLLVKEECNLAVNGHRLDEFVVACISLVGLRVCAAEKTYFHKSLDFILTAFNHRVMFQKDFGLEIGHQLLRQRKKQGKDSFVDRAIMVNREGQEVGEYTEDINGRISVPRSNA